MLRSTMADNGSKRIARFIESSDGGIEVARIGAA
jgi:hypothetical protein